MAFLDNATAKSARFEINAPQVAQEVMGGEAMIINFDSGAYYSAEGTGAEIWTMACSGASAEEITAVLADRYRTGSKLVAGEVDAFLRRLMEEGLLRPAQRNGEFMNRSAETDLPAPSNAGGFLSPLLQKYIDMEDLLLLDPIHDVNEQGWPQRKAERQHG